MVLIIDGEIVADNDPRAVARRKGQQASPGTQAPPRPGASGGGLPPNSAARQAPGGAAGATGSPLDTLAAAIGIEGQVVTIPRLHARIPERQVPMVAAGLLGVATLFFGWRVLALAAALHVISGLSETAPAAAPAGGAAGGRPR